MWQRELTKLWQIFLKSLRLFRGDWHMYNNEHCNYLTLSADEVHECPKYSHLTIFVSSLININQIHKSIYQMTLLSCDAYEYFSLWLIPYDTVITKKIKSYYFEVNIW